MMKKIGAVVYQYIFSKRAWRIRERRWHEARRYQETERESLVDEDDDEEGRRRCWGRKPVATRGNRPF